MTPPPGNLLLIGERAAMGDLSIPGCACREALRNPRADSRVHRGPARSPIKSKKRAAYHGAAAAALSSHISVDIGLSINYYQVTFS